MLALIDWQDIVYVPVVAGLVGVVALTLKGAQQLMSAWFDSTEKRIRDRNSQEVADGKRRHFAGIETVLEWRAVLDDIKELACVERVLVFRGADSGSVPRPGEPYFVNCIGGFSTDPKAHPEKFYAGQIAPDDHYFRLLMVLLDKRYAVMTTSEMPQDSMLRGFYESEGVFQSLMFLLTADEKEVRYCSVANYSRAFAPFEVYRITALVSQARGLMGGSSLEVPALPAKFK